MIAEKSVPGKKSKYAPNPYAKRAVPVYNAMEPKETLVIVKAPALPSMNPWASGKFASAASLPPKRSSSGEALGRTSSCADLVLPPTPRRPRGDRPAGCRGCREVAAGLARLEEAAPAVLLNVAVVVVVVVVVAVVDCMISLSLSRRLALVFGAPRLLASEGSASAFTIEIAPPDSWPGDVLGPARWEIY